jgi:hypothetical protein
MNDEQLAKRAQEVNDAGIARHGAATWGRMMAALGSAGPSPQQVAATLQAPDAVSQFTHAAKECLLREVQNGDREAERAYDTIREAERSAYRNADASAYRKLQPNGERR